MTEEEYKQKCLAMHEEMCRRGEFYYRDPQTYRIVFTRVHHLKRGECCQSGCRHCPFGKSPWNEKI